MVVLSIVVLGSRVGLVNGWLIGVCSGAAPVWVCVYIGSEVLVFRRLLSLYRWATTYNGLVACVRSVRLRLFRVVVRLSCIRRFELRAG